MYFVCDFEWMEVVLCGVCVQIGFGVDYDLCELVVCDVLGFECVGIDCVVEYFDD